MEVDKFGLDEMDRKFMLTIIEKFDGGPVGLGTISASIHEEKDSIEEIIEPYLIQIGFLDRTPPRAHGHPPRLRTLRHHALRSPQARPVRFSVKNLLGCVPSLADSSKLRLLLSSPMRRLSSFSRHSFGVRNRGPWRSIISHSLHQFHENDLFTSAAAMSYFGLMALFPALLLMLAISNQIAAATELLTPRGRSLSRLGQVSARNNPLHVCRSEPVQSSPA